MVKINRIMKRCKLCGHETYRNLGQHKKVCGVDAKGKWPGWVYFREGSRQEIPEKNLPANKKRGVKMPADGGKYRDLSKKKETPLTRLRKGKYENNR
jgi:hypothetical protein